MSNELGTIPKGDEGRDAVHVAIVPVQADEYLPAGVPVRLNAKSRAERCRVEDAIGVVDPFRPQSERDVLSGSWFWLCLYPKTITGLRHVWEHPCLPKFEAEPDRPLSDIPSTSVADSQKWIQDYVREHCADILSFSDTSEISERFTTTVLTAMGWKMLEMPMNYSGI